MILNVFALLFVLAITFVHSMFGLYSGLINVFCCITALATAFGFFEPLNGLLTGQIGLHPSYTEPFALVLLFVVTLIVLRTLTDTFMRGNVRVPMYVDWGGGAVCGFVTGQICVGIMALGFLMLPWGGKTMMFSRYERDPENRVYRDAPDVPPELKKQDERVVFTRNDLWLRSDAFAVGLFNLLSRGSLRGDTTLASVYPDFPEWVFWSGNTVQRESLTAPMRDDKGDGFKDGLKCETWWEQTERLTPETTRYRKIAPDRSNAKPPYEPFDYKVLPGRKLLGMRLSLNKSAADREKTTFYHRLRPSMIRLVGDIKLPDGSLEPRAYVPQLLGGADPNVGNNLRVVDIDTNIGLAADGKTSLEAYFEVDDRFEPRFVEYRRHARAPASAAQKAKTPPSDRLAAAGAGTPGGPDKASGAARFIDTVNRQATGDRSQLPFAMRLDKVRPVLEVTLEGTQFASGRLAGDRSTLESKEKDAKQNVAEFKVPAGRRLFQIQTKPRKAKSLPGQAMNFVGAITNQYQAVDDSGESYPLTGYYAIIKKGDQDYIELVYLPDDPSFRGMLDFKEASVRNDLQNQDDAVLGLMFLVPPGRSIVAISSQGGRVDFGETYKMQQDK